MALTDFTTYSEIRAILGVADDELTDATIGLSLYTSGLAEDLLEIGETLEADFATVSAVSASDRSAKQQRLWRTTRMYAAFSLAKRIGAGLSMFGPKDITDGKAGVSRFSDAPYKATMKNVEAELGLAKQRVTEAFLAYGSSTALTSTRTYFAVSSPSTDPVTGS